MASETSVETRRILPVGVSLLGAGIALLTVAVIWARYFGGGVFAIVVLFAGLILTLHQAGLERGGHQRLWRSRTTEGPPQTVQDLSQFDSEVLKNAISLAHRIGIEKFQIRRVSWGPTEAQIRNVASRECHFDHDELVLASGLRDELEADDWTPLIAVSLIYEKKLMPRIFRKRQLFFLIPWIAGLASLGVLMSYPEDSIFALPFFLWLFLPLVVAIRLWGLTDRRMRLLANSEAGDLVGRERLASVLAKLSERFPKSASSLQIEDELPSIGQRLRQVEPLGAGFTDPEVRRVNESLHARETEFQARSRVVGWRRHRRSMFTIIFLICFIVPIAAFLAWDNAVCPLTTIIPSGTRLTITPLGHSDHPFLVPNVIWNSRPIWGSFRASQPVSFYVMTADQYQNFSVTGKPASYLFNSGPVISARYECSGNGCPSQPFGHLGQEYVIIDNPSSSALASVTINEPITLGGC